MVDKEVGAVPSNNFIFSQLSSIANFVIRSKVMTIHNTNPDGRHWTANVGLVWAPWNDRQYVADVAQLSISITIHSSCRRKVWGIEGPYTHTRRKQKNEDQFRHYHGIIYLSSILYIPWTDLHSQASLRWNHESEFELHVRDFKNLKRNSCTWLSRASTWSSPIWWKRFVF